MRNGRSGYHGQSGSGGHSGRSGRDGHHGEPTLDLASRLTVRCHPAQALAARTASAAKTVAGAQLAFPCLFSARGRDLSHSRCFYCSGTPGGAGQDGQDSRDLELTVSQQGSNFIVTDSLSRTVRPNLSRSCSLTSRSELTLLWSVAGGRGSRVDRHRVRVGQGRQRRQRRCVEHEPEYA